MANTNLVRGLVPIPDAYGLVRTKLIAKGTGSSAALFVNSPYVQSGGYAVSVADTASATVSGAVVALRDSNGKPRQNLGASEAGTVEVTFDKSQRFRTSFNADTNFAGPADVGKVYQFVAESATAASATSDGDSYSKMVLEGATEHADDGGGDDGPITVLGAIRRLNNDAGAAYCEVECIITPLNFVQA